MTALAVDTLGSGMFVPFAILYFVHTTAMSLSTIGTALSVAALLALPTPLAASALVDRWSAKSVVALGDVISAGAYLSYLVVRSPAPLVVAALMTSLGWHTYWTGIRALAGSLAAASERRLWFSMQSMIRNAGYGLGGVVGAVVVDGHGVGGYRALVLLDAASYAITGALLLFTRVTEAVSPAAEPSQVESAADRPPTPQRALLRDRALWAITCTNLVSVLCQSVLTVLLPVYIVVTLHQPTYVAGVIFTTNTVLVVLGQACLSSMIRRRTVRNVLVVAFGVWGASFALMWTLVGVPGWVVLPGLFVAITVWTAAEVLASPTVNAAVVDIAPEGRAGSYLSFFQLSWSTGIAMAPIVLIRLLALGAAWPWILLMTLCMVPVAVPMKSLSRATDPR